VKEIVLTQGKIALVDDEDFEALKDFKWCALKSAQTFYAVRQQPRSLARELHQKRRHFRMHQVIFGAPPEGKEIDHKDGNGLNNQKSNLRFVTRRQNLQNIINHSKTSKYPGVDRRKNSTKWRACINICGEKKVLGVFLSETAAFNCYRAACESIGESVL
jgi:hypothetical protein